MEQELKEQKEYAQLLLRRAHLAPFFLVDNEGKIISWNERACRDNRL